MSGNEKDWLRKLLLQSDPLRRLTAADSTFEAIRRTLELDSAGSALAKAGLEAQRMNELHAKVAKAVSIPDYVSAQIQAALDSHERFRAALGPIDDFQRLRDLHAERIFGVDSQLAAARKQIEASFRRPEYEEAKRIFEEVNQTYSALKIESSAVLAAATRMRVPWLERNEESTSALGFAKLQSLGETLRHANPFEDAVTGVVRSGLGDWRDEVSWPEDIFDDIKARSDFYSDRGFDPSLTNFPAPAFEEGVEIAGLDEAPPPIIEIEDYEIPVGDPVEQSAFARTHAAQGRLLRFEHHLRRFIDAEMTAAFGERWIKHRVDGDTREKWLGKQKAAVEGGARKHPLIDYADFTDYERIILRSDNWSKVFEPVFKNSDSTRESLRRLYPVRLCSYHARLISQDDEIILYIEVKRILTAIGVLRRSN